jgi:hypothetical protein
MTLCSMTWEQGGEFGALGPSLAGVILNLANV